MPTVKTTNNGCDRHRIPSGGDIVEAALKIDGVMAGLQIGTA
jgi:hypothetical protein